MPAFFPEEIRNIDVKLFRTYAVFFLIHTIMQLFKISQSALINPVSLFSKAPSNSKRVGVAILLFSKVTQKIICRDKLFSFSTAAVL